MNVFINQTDIIISEWIVIPIKAKNKWVRWIKYNNIF